MGVKVSWSLLLAAVALAAVMPGTASAQDAPAAAPDAGVLAPSDAPAPRKARRRRKAVEAPDVVASGANDLAGRYAVVRDKRDTGCMITLDRGRVKGGSRAQLAPGCRDQGIVVFDPSSWQIVKGSLVLTARAGHKAVLQKQAEGVWKKDAKEGKPLGLKRL